MYTKKILAVCTVCAIFLSVNSIPVDRVITRTGKIYKLVPIHNLQRARRDVFSETINDKDGKTNTYAVTKPTTVWETRKNGEEGEKREMLKVAADTNYPVVYRIRRANHNIRKYEDGDNDYNNDDDYAGYDRKGSEVGYMEANDDFPTVVW